MYFVIAFIPLYIAYAALIAHPELKALFESEDARAIQRILPDLVLGQMPMWAQILFFGALLSAILSTASGALLAPTATFTENVLKPFVPHMSDRQFLLLLRIILVTFCACALLFALNSNSTMYEMVQNAYNVTLTGAFVPWKTGAFWPRANTQGALMSVVLGVGTWLALSLLGTETLVPANLLGLFASILGMVIGSLMPSLIPNQGHSMLSALHRASMGGHSDKH
jgi:Na+/proline symporter